MMKKFALIFSIMLLATIFIGCSNNSAKSDDLLECSICGFMNNMNNDFCAACGCGIKASNGNSKVDFYEEPDQTTPPSKDGVNFDLSQYNDHGELSDGLIWVEKTESAWNSDPEDFFAYFDADGTRKSQWFSCDEYWPEDFQNNYVVLRGVKRAFEDNWDYHRCTVYNKSFSEITSLYCRTPALSPSYISNFNSQGYSFAVAYDERQKDDVLYWIDAQGEHIFQDPIDGEAYSPTTMVDEYSLGKFKYSNDYFVLVDGSSDPNYLYTKIAQIYDKHGNFILDLDYQMQKHTEDCAITSAEVLSDNVVEFYFYGMDKNKYVCVMDFDGDFIKAPVLQSEYIRPSEDEYKKYSEEWKEVDNPPKQTAYTDKATYTVKVVNEDGDPIAHVGVQLCLETCSPSFTNEEGIATYHVEVADYKVSVFAMPEGYELTTEKTDFYFSDGATVITLTLRAIA